LFLKKTSSLILWCFVCFLSLYCICFCFDVYCFFPPNNLGFGLFLLFQVLEIHHYVVYLKLFFKCRHSFAASYMFDILYFHFPLCQEIFKFPSDLLSNFTIHAKCVQSLCICIISDVSLPVWTSSFFPLW
jgi:hypothetical protein